MSELNNADRFDESSDSRAFTSSRQSRGASSTSHQQITASRVTEILRLAQKFQSQSLFNNAIDLYEQILESGFDRSDIRSHLGWLYQEQQRWSDAIHQFQRVINDPEYAISCYYAIGQCYRACGDMRKAVIHFDKAVNRVNLDEVTIEEVDQLIQLCQETAEAHRKLDEQEQAMTVYLALLDFLKSRGWNDKSIQLEFILRQIYTTSFRASAFTRLVTIMHSFRPMRAIQSQRSSDVSQQLTVKQRISIEATPTVVQPIIRLSVPKSTMAAVPIQVPDMSSDNEALEQIAEASLQADNEYQHTSFVEQSNLGDLVQRHIFTILEMSISPSAALAELSHILQQMRNKEQKGYGQVISEYTHAADIYPNNAALHYALGQLYQRSGDIEKALNEYGRTMRDSVLEISARVGAAQCLFILGRPEAGIYQLERSLQMVRYSHDVVDSVVWAARPREEGEEPYTAEIEILRLLNYAYERMGSEKHTESLLVPSMLEQG